MGDIHLFSAIDQPLLHRRNAFLLLDPLFDLRHFIVRLNIEFDFFSREGADSIHPLARPRQVVAGGCEHLMSILSGLGQNLRGL